MQIGFNLPISGPLSSPDSLTRMAQQGEVLDYDYLTLTDHVVLRMPGYPYSQSGHEQLTAAAFIAAKTTWIRLVLAVMVVPHRPAVLAAKMLSTRNGGPIMFAGAVHLVQAFGVQLDHFHTYDDGKKRGSDRRSVPMPSYHEWRNGFTSDQMRVAEPVLDLDRCRPIHPNPRLPLNAKL